MDSKTKDRLAFLNQLPAGARVHLSGVCGTGMAQVAILLKQLGYKIQGSDKAFYPPMGPLIRSELDTVFEGYSAENLAKQPDLVVIGNSLSRDNPEVEHVLKNNIPYASMPEVFGALLIGDRSYCRNSVVVAGTHGKTTTSAAISVMLERAGKKPGYFIGGAVADLPTSIRAVSEEMAASERVVVLEGDEYDSAFFAKWAKFRSYRPDIAVVTGIEFDHADIYDSVDEIVEEFTALAQLLPEDGLLLTYSGSSVLEDAQASWAANSLSFGEREEDDYRLVSRECGEGSGQVLRLKLAGRDLEISSPLSGKHNALNLLAAAAVGHRLGLSNEQIADGLGGFQGVQRRQQLIAEHAGIRVIEDFAHHPTAVRLTVEGLREQFPKRRLISVFEPRSNTSRRDFFQEQYSKSFDASDIVVIKEVQNAGGYQKGEGKIRPLRVGKLVRDISQNVTRAIALANAGAIYDYLKLELREGDVLLIMSNGSFDGLMAEVKEFVERR